MGGLIASLFQLRHDPRLLKLPPYLSLVCIIAGVAWLFMLPLERNTRRTYISENALLPGQVHTYFGGSDHNIYRAYRHEAAALANATNAQVNDSLEPIIRSLGLKTGRQAFAYPARSWATSDTKVCSNRGGSASGGECQGENLYGILKAPRGDATEAIVLVTPWRNMGGRLNTNAVALTLTLARYFARWSLWSKDIVVLVPPDALLGPQAWVDAYHDAHDARFVASLPIKSGALQGAVALDYAMDHRGDADCGGSGHFEAVHIVYDGVNGQLPNLDLINTVNNVANGQMGISTALHDMYRHENNYGDRLRTMLRGMARQVVGRAVGAHSCFIPYHVDAITLQPYAASCDDEGRGWNDEMAMGRLVEGSFRSLNNLLEHLHQSFFFYLLMHRDRFVSIGTYLPSAMLLSVSFTIMAIFKWSRSGAASTTTLPVGRQAATTLMAPPRERQIMLPLAVVAGVHILGIVPLVMLNYAPAALLPRLFIAFAPISFCLPVYLTYKVIPRSTTIQQYDMIHTFVLLSIGMWLATLATLNFSLAFIVGVLLTPTVFVDPLRVGSSESDVQQLSTRSEAAVRDDKLAARWGWQRYVLLLMLVVASPLTTIFWCVTALPGIDGRLGLLANFGTSTALHGFDDAFTGFSGLTTYLRDSAFAWTVEWAITTPIVVWCLWWPAWVLSMVVLLSSPLIDATGRVDADAGYNEDWDDSEDGEWREEEHKGRYAVENDDDDDGMGAHESLLKKLLGIKRLEPPVKR